MSENISVERDQNEHWDITIDPQKNKLSLSIGDIWKYRDLLIMFVKKDIITIYKQTVLGPLWFFIQPIFTTIIFVMLFGRIAQLSPKGVPQFPFFLAGITVWGYFSDTLTVTSRTFTDNAGIFGKVFFPRLILPLSKILSGFAKFMIQFSLFLVSWVYFVFVTKQITPNWHLVFVPLIMVIMILMSLGFGILITSMTTKYRDLSFLVGFGMQLVMYATPVAYSISAPKLVKYQKMLWFNPLTSLFEAFKYGFFSEGIFSYKWLLYSTVFTVILLILGILSFNKVEKRFIDTV